MKLNSKKITVQKSAQELFDFLTNLNNFEQLMPENISKFEVIRENAFVFALKGMPEIALEIKEKEAPNKLVLGAISDKMPFTLTTTIDEINETASEAELHFEGKFNTMMTMMVKGPLTKFLETLSSKMENI